MNGTAAASTTLPSSCFPYAAASALWIGNQNLIGRLAHARCSRAHRAAAFQLATGAGSKAGNRSSASWTQERVHDRRDRGNDGCRGGDEDELSANRTFVREASRAPGRPTGFGVGV